MRLNIVEKALKLQNNGYYRIGHLLLSLFCIEIPKEVKIEQLGGEDSMRLVHRAPCVVIHPKTEIGKRVQIYQGVTIGKSKPWDSSVKEGGCKVEEDVILCAGAKVLFKEDKLIVGKGCIIGANAVLICSTGRNEIWAGNPAKLVGYRENDNKNE